MLPFAKGATVCVKMTEDQHAGSLSLSFFFFEANEFHCKELEYRPSEAWASHVYNSESTIDG